jgi:hypothetical protein
MSLGHMMIMLKLRRGKFSLVEEKIFQVFMLQALLSKN